MIEQGVSSHEIHHIVLLDSQPVPEPATCGLLLAGAVGLLGRRRRRN